MTKPTRYSLFLIVVTVGIIAAGIFVFDLLTIWLTAFFWLKYVILIIISIIIGVIIVITNSITIPYLKEFLLSYRSMLRFESLSHPLLIRLSLEAPGTYHHSLMVANLSYKAAKAIGADTILTRVGSYYHDVGKLINPLIFIENQNGKNDILVLPGNNTKADLIKGSKKIIEHVTYGLGIASKYGLPKEISVFIPEHHGTTVTRYFLEEAKKKHYKVKPSQFRYPGPKPLSRETAIVMLADAVEAKIRLVEKLNKDNIAEIVDEIINERTHEKELDLAGLTQTDLDKIRQSFNETLLTIHHQRINYPHDD